MPHIDLSNTKSARALELHEKGVPFSAIAERLGVSKPNVYSLIAQARKMRARKESKE